MGWIVDDPLFFIDWADGTFESAPGTFTKSNAGDTDAVSGIDHHSGTKSFRSELIGGFTPGALYPSGLSFNDQASWRGVGRFSIGKAITVGRRYIVSGWVKVTNAGAANAADSIKLRCDLGPASSDAVLGTNIVADFNACLLAGWTFFTFQIVAGSSLTVGASTMRFIWTWSDGQLHTRGVSPVNGSVVFFDDITITESTFVPPPPIHPTYVATNVTVHGGNNGAITVSTPDGTGPFTFVWNDGAITQNRAALVAGLYWVRVTDSLGSTAVLNITITQPDILAVSETHTNPTTIGGADGTISPSVTGGSGTITQVWNDAVTDLARYGLIAGTWTLTVTDTITGEIVVLPVLLTDPAPRVSANSFLEAPLLNSLRFVKPAAVDNCTIFQTPDNTLFCNQYYPGFTKTRYFQKVALCDTPRIQFNSDFPAHLVELYKHSTSELIKQFSPIMVQQNLGVTEDFPIAVKQDLTDGIVRVYFAAGPIPLPLSVGEAFVISGTADYDGTYAIVDIQNDTTLGYQFIMINHAYTVDKTGTATFTNTGIDFNVLEASVDFTDVAAGQYYVQITAIDDIGDTSVLVSEPIDLQASWPDTNLIEYQNYDNAFDITWRTGYIGRKRVESILFEALPGGISSVSRNSDYSLVKVNAKKQRIFNFSTYMLPPYLHEALSVIFDLDLWKINGVQYQSEAEYNAPSYLDRFKLANSSIKIEQAQWFRKYNSDDIGTVQQTTPQRIYSSEYSDEYA